MQLLNNLKFPAKVMKPQDARTNTIGQPNSPNQLHEGKFDSKVYSIFFTVPNILQCYTNFKLNKSL